MQLAKHPDQAYAVRRIENGQLEINGEFRTAPYAVSSTGLQALPQHMAGQALTLEDVTALMQLGTEVVLLATGAKTVFPSAEIRAAFLSKRVGLEVMDTRAAAFTYNVLIQEQRDVCLVVLS
jgi:uncharacterized protein